MDEHIDSLAHRVRDDEYFLASAFAVYQTTEQLDAAGLAAALACEPDILGPLALCRRPREPHFQRDIDLIVERFALDAGALTEILRRADAIDAFRRPAVEQSFTAAARDRSIEPPEGQSENDPQ